MAKKGEKNPQRAGYGLAKVQFIENLPEITELIARGYFMKDVYDHLVENKKITMSISSFRNMCKPTRTKERIRKYRRRYANERRSISSNEEVKKNQ